MREELRKLFDNKQHSFSADISAFSIDNKGNARILLEHLSCDGKEVADHTWVRCSEISSGQGYEFRTGDKITFDAYVRQYTHGERGMRPGEVDYSVKDFSNINNQTRPRVIPSFEVLTMSKRMHDLGYSLEHAEWGDIRFKDNKTEQVMGFGTPKDVYAYISCKTLTPHLHLAKELTDPETLHSLALETRDFTVLKAIIRNKHTSDKTIDVLLERGFKEGRKEVQ